jgi:plastocyanin
MDNQPTPNMQPNAPVTSPDHKMPGKTRAIIISLLIAVVLVAAAIIGYLWWQNQQDAAPSGTGSTAQVTITKDGFTPATISITKGQRISFNNSDNDTHELKPASPAESPLDSKGAIGAGEVFITPFDDAGTYTYFDPLNPDLKGTVIVE